MAGGWLTSLSDWMPRTLGECDLRVSKPGGVAWDILIGPASESGHADKEPRSTEVQQSSRVQYFNNNTVYGMDEVGTPPAGPTNRQILRADLTGAR